MAQINAHTPMIMILQGISKSGSEMPQEIYKVQVNFFPIGEKAAPKGKKANH